MPRTSRSIWLGATRTTPTTAASGGASRIAGLTGRTGWGTGASRRRTRTRGLSSEVRRWRAAFHAEPTRGSARVAAEPAAARGSLADLADPPRGPSWRGGRMRVRSVPAMPPPHPPRTPTAIAGRFPAEPDPGRGSRGLPPVGAFPVGRKPAATEWPGGRGTNRGGGGFPRSGQRKRRGRDEHPGVSVSARPLTRPGRGSTPPPDRGRRRMVVPAHRRGKVRRQMRPLPGASGRWRESAAQRQASGDAASLRACRGWRRHRETAHGPAASDPRHGGARAATDVPFPATPSDPADRHGHRARRPLRRACGTCAPWARNSPGAIPRCRNRGPRSGGSTP